MCDLLKCRVTFELILCKANVQYCNAEETIGLTVVRESTWKCGIKVIFEMDELVYSNAALR